MPIVESKQNILVNGCNWASFVGHGVNEKERTPSLKSHEVGHVLEQVASVTVMTRPCLSCVVDILPCQLSLSNHTQGTDGKKSKCKMYTSNY